MGKSFQVGAETRNDQGKGASRRLRHAGKVPAILYGGKGEAANITLNQLSLQTMIDDERFYSTIITVNVDGKPEQAIVKDVQIHPARSTVVHVDLQRVLADQPIRIHLPIHFLNAATSPGRQGAGRHRVAPQVGRGNRLPAQGPARVAVGGHGPDEPQRDAVPQGHPAAGGRDDSGADQGS